MSKKHFLIILIILIYSGVSAQTAKYSNEFLSLGIGARGLAMSGAITASTSGGYSTYWNPAGLVEMRKDKNFALMHSEYFAGIAKFDYGVYATKVGQKSALAFSLIRFGVDNIPNTSQLIDANGNINYDKVTSFSAADYAFTISFAHRTNIEGLTYGFNTKIIRRVAGDFAKSWGFGIDFGTQYRKKNWFFGARFRDITTTINSWSYTLSDEMVEVFALTGNDIPISSTEITLPALIIGAAHKFILHEDFSILAELDAIITTDGKRNVLIKGDPFSIDPKLGLEFGFKDIVFLRGGIGNFQQETAPDGMLRTSYQPNIGLGLIIRKSITIDYALTDIGNQSIALYSNVFSIKFSFNSKSHQESYEDH